MNEWTPGTLYWFEDEAARLTAENAKLRAALERLIKDYEDETGEKAMAARTTLEETK